MPSTFIVEEFVRFTVEKPSSVRLIFSPVVKSKSKVELSKFIFASLFNVEFWSNARVPLFDTLISPVNSAFAPSAPFKSSLPPSVLLIVPPPLRADEIVVSLPDIFKIPAFKLSCAAASIISPPEMFPPVKLASAAFPIVREEFVRAFVAVSLPRFNSALSKVIVTSFPCVIVDVPPSISITDFSIAFVIVEVPFVWVKLDPLCRFSTEIVPEFSISVLFEL